MKVKLRIYWKKRETTRLQLLSFIFLSLALFFVLNSLHRKEEPPPEKREEIPQPVLAPAPPLQEKREIIKKRMTLTDILRAYDLSVEEISILRKAVKPVYDLSRIKSGHELRIYTTEEGKLVSLEYDIDEVSCLYVRRDETGYAAEIDKIPYDFELRMIWGVIEDNLISAVVKEKEKSALALDLADLFGWDIDFYADLRQGDTFKIIFEKKYLHGQFIGYRNILAAEFSNQGKTFKAFRYTYPDTKESDYFDSEGNSLRKEFLKSPIKYSRITSRFRRSRLHPIRKVFQPHYGVDYAARVGTAVQATADGTVVFVGDRGASGRMVTIRHKNDYETMYLHLMGYAPGIRKGARIEAKQEIGYVGLSGESTGPHLDYRIKHRGEYINPLAFNPEPIRPLRAEYRENFKREAKNYLCCFDAPFFIYSCFFNSSINLLKEASQ